jgi:hypothetical protein
MYVLHQKRRGCLLLKATLKVKQAWRYEANDAGRPVRHRRAELAAV